MQRRSIGVAASLAAICLFGVFCLFLWRHIGANRAERATVSAGETADGGVYDAVSTLGHFADACWRGQQVPVPPTLLAQTHGVYVAARAQGRRLAHTWGDGSSAGQALSKAIVQLRLQLKKETRQVDRLEVFIAEQSRGVDPEKEPGRLFDNMHRGVWGLAVDIDGKRQRFSPTYAIATNRSNRRILERLGVIRDTRRRSTEQRAHIRASNIKESAQSKPRYRILNGPQWIITLGNHVRAQRMERGNQHATLRSVTVRNVGVFTDRMAEWLWNSLHDDGRMTYLYWPSREEEAPASRNNLIRQFMASIALGRLAARDNTDALWQRSANNIDYNLKHYFRREGPLGFVELNGKVKLGAIALAALAIVEHRDRAKWREQELALRRSVRKLWRPDGSFRTFYKPAERNDNQNFYPGEALLLWATLYEQDRDAARLDRIMRSFRYYKRYHLDTTVRFRRNPAFIPWHTQAYYKVWCLTHDRNLRDFIFEINDWLLSVQQWGGAVYRDTRGRFYDPKRPFGPPHASSTGVYLEGLTDAYLLAQAVGDAQRAAAYRKVIRRGLRSSMQLQFVDDIDMFYINRHRPVYGGLRTRVYDNQIRCDNVQHTLMATLKILDSDLLADPK